MATFSLDIAATGVNAAVSTTAGFTSPFQSTPSADNNGLPFTNIVPGIGASWQRNIITWFVPQYGTVRMFINPARISYMHKKLIQKDRTKGGFTLQYWGEELDTLAISGTTGSSGIEGINMLYEIYRAEQYAMDAVALNLEGNNASADLNNNLSLGIGVQAGSLLSIGASLGTGATSSGILGLDSPNNSLSTRNLPSLASLAFAVQMYYNGWVYRGYFTDMTVNEKADDFLLDYSMNFVVTQRSGYRTNYFPWTESPVSGPSSYTTPYSFSGNVQNNPAPTTDLLSAVVSLF